jgi:hypothetical protein
MKKMIVNRRVVLSLAGIFIFLLVFNMSAGAEDLMSWHPRTPAGGGYIADPDYYFTMAKVVKYGSQSLIFNEYQVVTDISERSFNSPPILIGIGYWKLDEHGNITYFDAAGGIKSPDGFATVERLENGIAKYYNSSYSVKESTSASKYTRE